MGSDTDVTTNSTRRLASSLTNIPNIIIVSSYTPTQSYITINNSRRTRRREAKSVLYCTRRGGGVGGMEWSACGEMSFATS